MKQEQALDSLAAGFAKLMASQLASKVFTFAMNLWVARNLSPEAYGLGAVQFHLVTTTILQISREGFRRSCVRAPDQDTKAGGVSLATRVLGVSWLCIPWGMLVAAAVCGVVVWRTPGAGMASFHEAVLLHGLAAVLELLSEPFFILANVHLAFGVRAAVDGVANVAKCGVMLMLLLHTAADPALVFSVAALVFSGLTCLGFFLYALQLRRQGQLQLQPHAWDAEDRHTLLLTGLFMLQSLEKLVLAEGSKLVLVLVDNSYNQGVFGLVNNLGSLVVRLIFAPFEDAAFTAFSRAGVAAQGKPKQQQQLGQVLAVLVRGVTLLGLLAVTFGPWYAYVMLRLVYGVTWADTEAPLVLSCYTGYILLLAVNGVTEAFTHAVLGVSGLNRSNALLLVFTGAHLAASLLLVTRLGACGLIAADALNMVLRVSYSLWCIRHYFAQVPSFQLQVLLPTKQALLGYAASAAVLAASYHTLLRDGRQPFMVAAGLHVSVGVAGLAVLGVWLYRSERATLQQLIQLQRSKAAAPGKME